MGPVQSTEEALELIVGKMAQTVLADLLPGLVDFEVRVSNDKTGKPQAPRIVITAKLRSDDQAALVGAEFAHVYSVDAVIEVPPSDTRAQPAAYQLAVEKMATRLVSPKQADLSMIDSELLSIFDLLIITETSGGIYEIDNDRIQYGATVSVLAHRTPTV